MRFLTKGLGFVLTAMYRDDDGPVEHTEARWPDGGGVMFGSRGKPGHLGGPRTAGRLRRRCRYRHRRRHLEPGQGDRRGRGAAGVLQELHDTDYGSHQFDIRDSDGNLWTVGTYRGA